MGVAKVRVDGVTIMDVSQDTVNEENLEVGYAAVCASGDKIVGNAQSDNEDALLNKTLSGEYVNKTVTSVRSNLFMRQYGLTKASFPNAITVGHYAFYYCTSLKEVNLPKVTSIDSYCFKGDTQLTTVNTSATFTTVPSHMFYGCTALVSMPYPRPTVAYESAFYNCSKLSNIDLSQLSTIKQYAFYGCTSLPSILENSKLTSLHNTAAYGIFKNCTSLSYISLPNLTSLYNDTQAFYGCTALTSVNLPKLNQIYASELFRGCTKLQGIVLPSVKAHNAQTQVYTGFYGCTSLEYIDIYHPYSILTNSFYNCAKLTILIIRSPSYVTSLAAIAAFTGTPFASAGTGGTLYVPEALIESYKAATNWSTILGYENNSILPIEGSDYEYYYANGTLIGSGGGY